MLETGQKVLAAQPFSALLGTEVLVFEQGVAELALDLKREHLQQNGFAHGGILSYLADNALTFAGGSVLGIKVLTLEFKINYLRPAKGARLIARARVIGSGANQAVCACDIFSIDNGEEKLCAAAQGTIWKIG